MENETVELPAKVEEVDALRLQSLELRKENIHLRFAAEMQALAAEFKEAWGTVKIKYGISDDDNVNCETFDIVRK